MKKDRNCGMAMPYPAYPAYPGTMGPGPGMPMNPNMVGPMQNSGPMTYPNMGGVSTNTMEEQMNNLQGQINMLDKRVSNLENAFLNKNNTNNSNYHIM